MVQVAALALPATVARPLPAGHVHTRFAPDPAVEKPGLQEHVPVAPVELEPTWHAEHVSAKPVRLFV